MAATTSQYIHVIDNNCTIWYNNGMRTAQTFSLAFSTENNHSNLHNRYGRQSCMLIHHWWYRHISLKKSSIKSAKISKIRTLTAIAILLTWIWSCHNWSQSLEIHSQYLQNNPNLKYTVKDLKKLTPKQKKKKISSIRHLDKYDEKFLRISLHLIEKKKLLDTDQGKHFAAGLTKKFRNKVIH